MRFPHCSLLLGVTPFVLSEAQQGPRFDTGPEIAQELQRLKQDQAELITQGDPAHDILFLLLGMPDSSHTPCQSWWCYSWEELYPTHMSQRRSLGWCKAVTTSAFELWLTYRRLARLDSLHICRFLSCKAPCRSG